MENVRVFPSASVSAGSSRVISRNWPALNVQFEGFSKRNAIVRSATSCLLTSLDRITGAALVVAMRSASRSSDRARLKCPVRGLFKAECDRAFRDFLPAHQFGQNYWRGFGSGHEISFSKCIRSFLQSGTQSSANRLVRD